MVLRSFAGHEAERGSCSENDEGDEEEIEEDVDHEKQVEDEESVTSVAAERWDVLGLGQAMVYTFLLSCPFQDFMFFSLI